MGRDNDRQLDEMKAAHERKMALLRAQQQKEESNLRESGEAAVNHIRRNADERVEQARADADAKVERESDAAAKSYTSLKKRSVQQNENNAKDVERSREQADTAIGANKSREELAMNESQEKLKDFLAKQRELRATTERKYADEVRNDETRFNQTRRKTQSDNDRELRSMDVDHKERMHELATDNQMSYEEAKSQAAHRLSQLRRDSDLQLKRERDQDNADFLAVHQKAHDDVQKEQQLGQLRLGETIRENQRKLESARGQALTMNEKTQRQYSNEAERVEVEGRADVAARRDKYDHLVREQKQQQKEEIASLSAEELAKKEQVRREGEGHIRETVEKLHQTLDKKVDQFNKQFAAEDKANHDSLTNQKDVFLREQYKLRSRQDAQVELEDARQFDPFYKPKSFDASLHEHEDKYVLHAKVPAYEKDNVEVRVKDGKVSLSSARAYKNAASDGDSHVETSSAQTYRQEFSLAKPADAKHVITHVADDGTITAIIPKKGFAFRS